MSSAGPSGGGGGGGEASSSAAVPAMPSIPASDPDMITPVSGRTPYASAPASIPGSATGFSASRLSARQPGLRVPGRYFHSRRVKKGDVSQPWLGRKDPKEKWVTIIPCVGLLIGMAICVALVWTGLKSVINHKYCLVLEEDWSNGFDESIWTREVEVGGFGWVLVLPWRADVVD